MSDAEFQIIRLLTEMRDHQIEESTYRRSIIQKSYELQKRAVRMQRMALRIVILFIALLVPTLLLLMNHN